jgi:PKHD-type hydroxylase
MIIGDQIRNSNITFLSEKWLYREIHPFIHAANRNAKWNFQWDFTEPLQFTKYETNQYYGWHQDQHPEPFLGRNNFFDNKIRKLSSTLLLTDEKEYKGGDLEFAFFGHPNLKKTQKSVCKTRKKGSIIIFPSFVWHRVKPVTKGVRHSLVSWSLGYPYK